MNYDIPRITELVDQLTAAAQPYIDALHEHPLYDEDFAHASGRLYIKHTNKLDEEDMGKNPLPFMSEDEYNLFVDCSMFWRDMYRVYTDAVITKINASRQIADRNVYGDGTLISDPDADPIDDVLREAEEAEEKTQALINAVEDLRQQLSLLAWVRYIESLKGNTKKIMKDIRYIASCVERPLIYRVDENDPDKGMMYDISVDHEYFAGREPVLVPNNINDRPFNREQLTEDLKTLFYYHLKALDYYGLPNKTATKVIQDAFTHMWSNPDAQHYNTSAIDHYYQPTDKVNKQITLLTPGETFKIDAANKKDRKKGTRIPIYATLQFEGLEEALKDSPAIITLNKLDPDDKQVLEGLITIWENCPEEERVDGYVITTPQILYRAMTRNPRARISKQKELELIERVKKLRHSFIRIDATQEAQAYHYSFDKVSLDGAIAAVTIGAAYLNNNLVQSAIFFSLSLSPLYNYAKTTNRIASTPVKMLDTKAVNKNSESSRIEQYLVQRIETFESQGNIILVSKIFDAAGIHEKDYKEFKNKRKRTIKKITGLLDGYVSTGYITEYHFNKQGRERYHSITFKKKND